MNLAGPFALGALMFGDGLLMSRQNRELAIKTLRFPYFFSVIWAAVTMIYLLLGPASPDSGGESGIFSKTPDPGAYIALFFYLFIFPIYALRRQRFFREDPGRPSGFLDGDDRATRIYLGLEFFQAGMAGFFGSLIIELGLRGAFRVFQINLPEIDELMVSVFFSTVLALVIIHRSARKFSPAGFWPNVGFVSGVPWSRGVFVPIMAGMMFAGLASMTVMRNAGRQPQTPMSETLQTAQSSETILVFIAWAWLVAPIFEEIIFRGYCFHIFRKSLGRGMAVGLITLAFAVLHVPQYWGDWVAIVAVAATGLGLTLLRDWSGTTRASLIMHLVYNVGVTMIPAIILTAQNPFYHQYTAKFDSLTVSEKEDLLRKNIAYNREFPDAYNDLAWLYAEEKIHIEEGLRLIDEALAMTPNNSAYKDTKAELLEVRGDYEQALMIRKDIVDNSYSDDMIDRQRDRIEQLKELMKETP